MPPLTLPSRSNPGRYTHDGATRLVNCYAETTGADAKAPFAVYAVDGLRLFSTLTGGGAVRGLFAMPGYMLAVSGQTVFRIDPSGQATAIGGMLGSRRVMFARNTAPVPQVGIVGEGQRFVYDGTALKPISDPDLPAPNSIDVIDTYALYGIDDGRFFFSALNDLTSIDALNYGKAEGNADGLRRLFVKNREVWLLGELTTEIWTDTGDNLQPFQRLAGAVLEFGILAAASLAQIRTQLLFVDHTGRVVQAERYTPQRVSTSAVERAIAGVADPQTIEGFGYSARGHDFYVLNSPTWTWVFDLIEGQWHEQMSFGLTRRLWSSYCNFSGRHIVGDYAAGKLYEVHPTALDDAGATLPMLVRAAVHSWPSKLKGQTLYIDHIPGTGLNVSKIATLTADLMTIKADTGQYRADATFVEATAVDISADTTTLRADATTRRADVALSNPAVALSSPALDITDPQIMVSVSRDGGITFGTERFVPVGKQGNRKQHLRLNRWGKFSEDGAVFNIATTTSVTRGLMAMQFDTVPGPIE